MEKNVRELTAREKQRIGRLVKDRCANYLEEDFFTGCLPLDCECPMLGKAYCGNAMCRYFRESVLPNDPELEAVLTGVAAKRRTAGRQQSGHRLRSGCGSTGRNRRKCNT